MIIDMKLESSPSKIYLGSEFIVMSPNPNNRFVIDFLEKILFGMIFLNAFTHKFQMDSILLIFFCWKKCFLQSWRVNFVKIKKKKISAYIPAILREL